MGLGYGIWSCAPPGGRGGGGCSAYQCLHLLVNNSSNRATATAVAAPITHKIAELHYITRGAQNVKDANLKFHESHQNLSDYNQFLFKKRIEVNKKADFF